MKPTMNTLAFAAFAANAFFMAATQAADYAVQPAQGTQGNVSFISGGVGEDEAAAMKSAAATYPLELQFVRKATPRDEFLADVKVTIRDRAKNVMLDVVSDGPFLLAKLPSGTYQVEAEHYGVTKRQTIDVRTGKHGRAVFVWTGPEDSNALNTAGTVYSVQ